METKESPRITLDGIIILTFQKMSFISVSSFFPPHHSMRVKAHSCLCYPMDEVTHREKLNCCLSTQSHRTEKGLEPRLSGDYPAPPVTPEMGAFFNMPPCILWGNCERRAKPAVTRLAQPWKHEWCSHSCLPCRFSWQEASLFNSCSSRSGCNPAIMVFLGFQMHRNN